jgi:hypothetical protein
LKSIKLNSLVGLGSKTIYMGVDQVIRLMADRERSPDVNIRFLQMFRRVSDEGHCWTMFMVPFTAELPGSDVVPLLHDDRTCEEDHDDKYLNRPGEIQGTR